MKESSRSAFQWLSVLHSFVDNDIGVGGAIHIATALQQNQTMTSLNLQGTNEQVNQCNNSLVPLVENNIGVGGLVHIAMALQQNQTLTTLNLCCTNE